ncbi:MAG TPA: heat-inducible transcriptional repressor HrcA [Vicinamibacterales bacterium]|nr:heat-inducible transcriptional repressor HrcA [Vicinamibacterales bacterium]
MNPDLTERQRRILARLVGEYIEQGEPISSSWLAEHSALGVSSATVRNILARLEEHGLVRQPHTSAGRVPTDSGYRFYVDGLLGARKRQRLVPELEARLRRAGTVSDLLENASQELSRASHHVGFAMAPASQTIRLQHIDFVSLDGRRVLVVVVATGGQINHKVIEPEEEQDSAALHEAANYINHEFSGLTLHEARGAILEQLRQERVVYDVLMARALRLAQTGLEDVGSEETLHVQGASLLLDGLLGELADRDRTLDTLRALVGMIEEKHRLIQLLTQYLEASGLTVVIGSEHSHPDFHAFSLVASTFQDGDRTGTIGVIGPTRMRYQRAIAVVDGMSQAVTKALEGQ